MRRPIALGAAALLTLVVSAGAAAKVHHVEGQVPKLVVLEPDSGDTVRAPFPLRYSVTGFRLGGAPYGHIQVYVGSLRGLRLDVTPTKQAGEVIVPSHPLLSGKRTLIFALARPNHTLLVNRESRVTVRDVVITGRRGA